MIWSTPGIVVGEDPAFEASDDAIEATAGFGAIVKAMRDISIRHCVG